MSNGAEGRTRLVRWGCRIAMRRGCPAIPLLLLAWPALAQFDLQVVDSIGSHTAPAVYDMGATYGGQALSARFQLRNVGGSPAVVSKVTVAGVGFGVTVPALPVTLAPQAVLEFTAGFNAPDLGSYSAVLRAENVTILLTAAVTPHLTYRVEDAALGAVVDFGSAQRGASVRRRFTVLNQTPGLLTVPAISLSGGDFAFVALPPSGTVLLPQQSTGFEIDFTPSVTGARAEVLILGDRSAVLVGTGLAPPLPHPSLSVDLKQPASAQQGILIVSFDQPAASSGTGTVVLDFRGSADPTVTFAGGGRTATFAVSPGDTRATVQFQTGTTAGTLVFTAMLGDASATLPVQIPTCPPALAQVQGVRTAGGIEVRVTGWDNTHSISQLAFTFYDGAGGVIAPGAIRVDASGDFTRYYSVSDVGGSFYLRAAFPVTGDAAQVAAVEVSLSDLIGTSKSARTPIQ